MNPWLHPKWITALLSSIGAVLGITGPLTTYVNGQREAELRRIEIELKQTEIELEQVQNRREYVLKVLRKETEPADKIALLEFLVVEFPDEAIQTWSEAQTERLAEQIQIALAQANERESQAKSYDADREKLRVEVFSLEEQLSAAQKLRLTSSAPEVRPEVACPRETLKFEVYKPFARNRSRDTYADPELSGILDACLDARESGETRWTTWYDGPTDAVPKRITCACAKQA